jgi:hypothetical protein
MIREDLECSKDIGAGLQIFVQRVKSKNPKEAEGEESFLDVYSDSKEALASKKRTLHVWHWNA